MERYLFVLLVLAVSSWAHPQYGGSGGAVGGGSGGITQGQCGHASYDCVPYFQCIDGVINTDGAGLIDVRIRPEGVCQHPEYPDVPAVCCLIPGSFSTPTPVKTCPQYQECVDFSLCSADGTIVTDGSGLVDIRTGYTSCYLPSGIGGICCNPPPIYVDNCPQDSACVLGTDCLGRALDASNNFIDYVNTGLWSHCKYDGIDGVCCIQPPPQIIDTCPGDSFCLPPEQCSGTALDGSGAFIDYSPQGSWTHCSQYDQGVCCVNPNTNPILRPAEECGIRNYQIDQRITTSKYEVNEAAFGEFPWQAIIFYQNYTFNCGASLISHKHLITAAHCVGHLLPTDIRIRLGEWQVNSFEEPLAYQDYNVLQVYVHPQFNKANVHNDIAVLELVNPIPFNYHINTVCLPNPGQIFDPYTPCFASGWGKDSFEGTFQHILKKIDIPYIDQDTCQTLLRKTRLGKYFKLDQSFMCAGGEENKDACYGDGGGPLVCKDQSTSRYVLVGITSWGIGCGTKDVPGVYANVQYFKNWVDEIIFGGQQQQQTVPGYGK